MLRRLIYASRATQNPEQADLLKLLETARHNNQAANITGMLVFASGDFLQVLEGEHLAIDSLFASISADRRHKNCRILSDTEIKERIFSDWSMGFRKMEKAQLTLRPGFVDFFNPNMTPKPLAHPSSAAQFFLLGFRDLLLEGSY